MRIYVTACNQINKFEHDTTNLEGIRHIDVLSGKRQQSKAECKIYNDKTDKDFKDYMCYVFYLFLNLLINDH